MKVIEVNWSDERSETWYWARRVRDGQSDEAALRLVRDDFSRHPRIRFGELVTPTFRIRQIADASSAAKPAAP